MQDQASALRQMVENLKNQRAREPGVGARLLCVTSGKGGVGKTSIAVNLAISLVKKGLRVLLFDADFGLSNIDVMMGVSPSFDISHVLKGQKLIRDIIAQGPGGVSVVAGGSGISELINMTELQLSAIINKLLFLDDVADIIIMDTGAGITPLITRMIKASQETIVVTTPEPTAIMDSYSLIKNISKTDEESRNVRLIVNRANSADEAKQTEQKFISVVKLYTGVDVNPLGYVLQDDAVALGVRRQQPFMLSFPRSAAARNIEVIAWRIMNATPEKPTGFKGFLSNLFSKNEE